VSTDTLRQSTIDKIESTEELPSEVEGTTEPSSGDVFMMPLEDGLLGACRVIRKGDPAKRHPNDWMAMTENGVLVAATAWVGTSPPDISEQKLRETLCKTFGEWNGEKELIWIAKPLPSEFKYIGKLQPTAEELELSSNENAGWGWLSNMVIAQCKWDKENN